MNIIKSTALTFLLGAATWLMSCNGKDMSTPSQPKNDTLPAQPPQQQAPASINPYAKYPKGDDTLHIVMRTMSFSDSIPGSDNKVMGEAWEANQIGNINNTHLQGHSFTAARRNG